MEPWEVVAVTHEKVEEEHQDSLSGFGKHHEDTHRRVKFSFEDSEVAEQWMGEELIPPDFQHPPLLVLDGFPTLVDTVKTENLEQISSSYGMNNQPTPENLVRLPMMLPLNQASNLPVQIEAIKQEPTSSSDESGDGKIPKDWKSSTIKQEDAMLNDSGSVEIVNWSDEKEESNGGTTSKVKGKSTVLSANTNSDKRHVCTDCGYRTARAHYLKNHMRTHTGDKPYACSECNYRAVRPDNLKNHMRTHSGQKPYGCTECDFRTSDNGSLRRHIRIHSGEKPYCCTECGFRTADAGHLKRHMRIHSGEKPHSCTECDFRTSRAGILKDHVRRKH